MLESQPLVSPAAHAVRTLAANSLLLTVPCWSPIRSPHTAWMAEAMVVDSAFDDEATVTDVTTLALPSLSVDAPLAPRKNDGTYAVCGGRDVPDLSLNPTAPITAPSIAPRRTSTTQAITMQKCDGRRPNIRLRMITAGTLLPGYRSYRGGGSSPSRACSRKMDSSSTWTNQHRSGGLARRF